MYIGFRNVAGESDLGGVKSFSGMCKYFFMG